MVYLPRSMALCQYSDRSAALTAQAGAGVINHSIWELCPVSSLACVWPSAYLDTLLLTWHGVSQGLVQQRDAHRAVPGTCDSPEAASGDSS